VVGAEVAGAVEVVVSTGVVTAVVVEVVTTDDATLELDELPLSLQLAKATTIATAQTVANVRPPLIDVPSERQRTSVGILACRRTRSREPRPPS
jgi:hypothetical protein